MSRLCWARPYDAAPILHALAASARVATRSAAGITVETVGLDELEFKLDRQAVLAGIEIPCATRPSVAGSLRYKPEFAMACAVDDAVHRVVVWGAALSAMVVERRGGRDLFARPGVVDDFAHDIADQAVRAAGIDPGYWRSRLRRELNRVVEQACIADGGQWT